MKKILIIFFVILALGGAAYFNRVKIKELALGWQKRFLPQSLSYEEVKNKYTLDGKAERAEIIDVRADLKLEQKSAAGEPSSPAKTERPEEFNLNIPFTPQAPYAVWDEIHKEACEEASVLMAAYFIRGQKIILPDEAEEEILKLVEWQKNNFGFWKDTDAEKTAEILKKFYGLKNAAVKYDITIDDIKKEIAAGHPVIVPAAGRLLKNPYYKPPGPFYHMLVARGYTKDKIITNDPGTRRGENFVYKNDVFINAIHDWNGGDVLGGRKAMIVVRDN